MSLSPRDFARALRRNATPEERALWQLLSQMRQRFTRQLRSDPFVADFACRRAQLLVELDGSHHAENEPDVWRTNLLERRGWHIIRFWNCDVRSNLDGVVRLICQDVQARLPEGEVIEFVASRAGRERTPRSRKKDHP